VCRPTSLNRKLVTRMEGARFDMYESERRVQGEVEGEGEETTRQLQRSNISPGVPRRGEDGGGGGGGGTGT